MVISRGAFESIERNFPIASRLVLENLKRRSEAQVAVEFPGIGSNRYIHEQYSQPAFDSETSFLPAGPTIRPS
jgi:hypothetical protein